MWLIDSAELINHQEGELLFNAGDPVNKTFVILDGKVVIYARQAGQPREIAEIEQGGITGYLPFSRAKIATGYGECVKMPEY